MTDTTAPDAITQIDSEAADALENELGFLSVEEMPKVRAAFAAHRRLAAHGAGEGLRDCGNLGWCSLPGCERHSTSPTDAGSTTREGWQPIKTAPKNDTYFDVWVPSYAEPGKGYRVTDLKMVESGKLFRHGETFPARLAHYPTHWRPRPDAPESVS